MTGLSQALVDTMRQHGYHPDKLKPSGAGFLRFRLEGESAGKTSGFIKLFPDGEGAIFGDFKSDAQFTWHAQEDKNLSPEQREAHRSKAEQARKEAAAEQARMREAAAKKATELWGGAGLVHGEQPYVLKKGIKPSGAKQLKKHIVVPVWRIDGALINLQFIGEDGIKRFLTGGEVKGGFCFIGEPAKTICIAEGWATACSIREATGHAVVVAFNAGNLEPVARALREKYPDARLIVCADNDQYTDGNPGITKATAAARAVGALLAAPDFTGGDLSSKPTDFNDLHLLKGLESVKQAIGAARSVDIPKHQTQRKDAPASDTASRGAAAKGELELLSPLAPPRMAGVGFPPLIREIVDAACASSEAHQVAVAANVIIFFSIMIGRGPFQRIGDSVIHTRPFFLIVGKSGKSRKGTAEVTAREVFRRADAELRRRLKNDDRLRVHSGGLSTGEGVAYAIRDPRDADDNGKGGDVGVNDKRLVVIEAEFDNVLSQIRRETNTLSATIRNLWDGRDIEPLTKTSQTRATRPHVGNIGHITGHELREKTSENDVANGLLNRYVIVYVWRPKLVALPEPTSEKLLDGLAGRVADAVITITGGDLHGNNTREMRLSDEARELWVELYPRLTRDRDGKGGSLMARSEVYARMFAMIFAAMDGRLEIEPCDLHAAAAWVEYWSASITYVFNCQDDEGEIDPFHVDVLSIITAQPGITLNDLQECWGRKRIKQVKAALESLLNLAPPLVEVRPDRSTGGRPALRYYANGKG